VSSRNSRGARCPKRPVRFSWSVSVGATYCSGRNSRLHDQTKTLGASNSTDLITADTVWKGCLIGWYDGFLGAGTGTFFIFLFIKFLRFDFLHASAAAKLVNVSTNLGALIMFIVGNDVLRRFAIPMAMANAIGGIIGGRFAILRGNKFIRRFFILIVACLLVKTGFDAVRLAVSGWRFSSGFTGVVPEGLNDRSQAIYCLERVRKGSVP
jgi:uncharacterized membrane protein YfcA